MSEQREQVEEQSTDIQNTEEETQEEQAEFTEEQALSDPKLLLEIVEELKSENQKLKEEKSSAVASDEESRERLKNYILGRESVTSTAKPTEPLQEQQHTSGRTVPESWYTRDLNI